MRDYRDLPSSPLSGHVDMPNFGPEVSVTCENQKEARLVSEQAGFYARQTWSSPPLYGSTIAKTLIGNPQFYDLWKKDLLTMSGRIAEMRTALRNGLTAQGIMRFPS